MHPFDSNSRVIYQRFPRPLQCSYRYQSWHVRIRGYSGTNWVTEKKTRVYIWYLDAVHKRTRLSRNHSFIFDELRWLTSKEKKERRHVHIRFGRIRWSDWISLPYRYPFDYQNRRLPVVSRGNSRSFCRLFYSWQSCVTWMSPDQLLLVKR